MSKTIKRFSVILIIVSICLVFSNSHQDIANSNNDPDSVYESGNNEQENEINKEIHSFDKESVDLKKQQVDNNFYNPDKIWTSDEFRRFAINFFVRDTEEKFNQLREKFEGPEKDKIKDFELGVQASVHLLDLYLKTIVFKDKDTISNEQAIDFQDMENFDNWGEQIDESVVAELEQYIPIQYKSRPKENIENESDSMYLRDGEEALTDEALDRELKEIEDRENMERNYKDIPTIGNNNLELESDL